MDKPRASKSDIIGREEAAIESSRWRCRKDSLAKDHEVRERSDDENNDSLGIASEEIASSSSSTNNLRLAKAVAKVENCCGRNSVIILIDCAAIAVRNGSSSQRILAHDHAVLAMLWSANSVRLLIDAAEIASSNGT